MAAARPSPALRPNLATSGHWPRRSARMPMRRLAAIAPRRWQGCDALPSDPRLPAGTRCLADHVTAPAELLRRLKQVAVVGRGQGPAAGGRAAAGHAGRPASPLGRVRRRRCRRGCGGAAATGQSAGRARRRLPGAGKSGGGSAWRSATARLPPWSNAGRPPRRARRGARRRARCARRDPRHRCRRPRRLSGSRRNAKAWPALGRSRAGPRRRARARSPRPSGRLLHYPIRPRSSIR